jgi:hypothetical protein
VLRKAEPLAERVDTTVLNALPAAQRDGFIAKLQAASPSEVRLKAAGITAAPKSADLCQVLRKSDLGRHSH